LAKHCLVAGLHFIIDTTDQELLQSLALRYAPFKHSTSATAEVPVLFALHHTDPFQSLAEARTIAEFACQGAWCVYAQTDQQIQITLQDKQTHEPYAQMQCDSHFNEARCWLSGPVWLRDYCYNNFIMMLFAFASMNQQTLLFHASVIERAGKAYLFLAKSGIGKSTHSALWLKHIPGCQLLNDDNPVVGIRNGQVLVYGSPWSGKTPCYRNEQYPVGGFIRLVRGQNNHLEREAVVPAFAAMLPACSGVKWDKQLYRSQGDTLSAIIGQVPVYTLQCTLSAEAARVCAQGVGAWDGTADLDFTKNRQSMQPAGIVLPS